MEKYEYYTFIYCMYHDDGCIIKGNHQYVPASYIMSHSGKCESCDWYPMGIISFDGSHINIIDKVRTNYDKYNGGFKFTGYIHTLTDEYGNYLDRETNSVLYEWILNNANNDDIYIE